MISNDKVTYSNSILSVHKHNNSRKEKPRTLKLFSETLPEYGNTFEHTGIAFKQTEKTSIQNKKSPITDKGFLNSLKTKINQKKSNTFLDDEGSRELQEKIQHRLGNRETNMNDSRNEQSSSKFQSNLPKPPITLPKHGESAYSGETCDYGNEDENPGKFLYSMFQYLFDFQF